MIGLHGKRNQSLANNATIWVLISGKANKWLIFISTFISEQFAYKPLILFYGASS